VRKIKNDCKQEIIDNVITNKNGLKQVAKDLSEKALTEAKTQLHSLLQQVELERLDQRREFLEAFKHALEKESARKIVMWQLCVQTVYKFDDPWGTNTECWDNTIHLLVLIPQLLIPMRELGAKLDRDILRRLKQLSWARFQKSKSIIEIQQVTLAEMRHGVSYGAMFLSLYAAPVQVWPRVDKQILFNDGRIRKVR
jgi:hypothetical protein